MYHSSRSLPLNSGSQPGPLLLSAAQTLAGEPHIAVKIRQRKDGRREIIGWFAFESESLDKRYQGFFLLASNFRLKRKVCSGAASHFLLLSNMLEKLIRNDITDAIRGTALARVIFVLLQIEPIIVCELLIFLEITASDDPDLVVLNVRFTIGRARVVDESGRVSLHATVQILLLIKCENILVVRLTAAQRLLLADYFPYVFNHSRGHQNIPPRKCSGAVNR